MKIALQADAIFEIPLTQAHVDVLILYAERHYDATCRTAAIPDRDHFHPFAGLLISWRNTIAFWLESGTPEHAKVKANTSQIDLLQKCLEYRIGSTTDEQEVLRAELQKVFRQCRRRWSDLYDQWHVEWDTEAA